MSGQAAPLKFLATVVGGWTVGRVAYLLPSVAGGVSSGVAVSMLGLATVPMMMGRAGDFDPPRPAGNVTIALESAPPVPPREGVTILLDDAEPAATRIDGSELWRPASVEIIPAPPPSIPAPAGEIASAPPRVSRWSGSAWLFARPDRIGPALAAGGQLGGSQAGVRLAYRLTDLGSGSLALAARLSTPLRDTRGAEAAIGLDWHPVRGVPFRLSAERRIALGRDGRDAWSAYAAGGFYQGGLPMGFEADGYAQAGVVGARSQDLFADAAVRVGRPVALPGGKRLVLGGGVWGAAQPGASRLDAGPRVALSVPAAGATVTGALEWRARVAGTAAPDSGAAFTLAADF